MKISSSLLLQHTCWSPIAPKFDPQYLKSNSNGKGIGKRSCSIENEAGSVHEHLIHLPCRLLSEFRSERDDQGKERNERLLDEVLLPAYVSIIEQISRMSEPNLDLPYKPLRRSRTSRRTLSSPLAINQEPHFTLRLGSRDRRTLCVASRL